jgi:putative ABC transport system permease protein
VVGVVEDVAHDHLGSIDEKVYMSHSQYGDDRNWRLFQTVRTDASPAALLPQIRAEVAGLDGELVVHNPRTMESVLGREVAKDKFALLLMGIFAGVALALSAIGIYGVLSYTVNQRLHEIGIRVALGATTSEVRGLVVRQVALLGGVGLGLGLISSLISGRILESMLFEVTTRDPLVFGSVTILLAAVAALGGWVPARRATSVSPMDSIRGD